MALVQYVLPDWIDSRDFEIIPQSRLVLAHLPTAVEPWSLPGLPEDTKVLIKRDDTTGDMLMAGNKIRKLEFLLAEALNEGCDCCITVGGTQSNHARATVAAARRIGIEPQLILRDDRMNHSEPDSGNFFLNTVLDARISVVPAAEFSGHKLLKERCDVLAAAGRRPYSIPVGGTCALGCWGYIHCFAELVADVADFSNHTIVSAVGSGATALGLSIGCTLFKEARHVRPLNVVGYAICDSPNFFYSSFDSLVAQLLRPVRCQERGFLDSRRLLQIRDAVGLGYGKASQDELQFMSRVARETGILLDPCYSNKAAFQMTRDATAGAFNNSTLLFVHTGGSPSSFAYQSTLAAARP